MKSLYMSTSRRPTLTIFTSGVSKEAYL